MSPEEYNRGKLDKLWGMLSLPQAFPGLQLLQQESDHATLSVRPDRVDWTEFSRAVREFQQIDTAVNPDGKLGQNTMRGIVDHLNHSFPLPDTNHIGDPILRLRRIAESHLGVEENASSTHHNPCILAYAREIGHGGIQDDETA